MRNARVGLLGEQFKGMGDFAVPFGVLKQSIGIEVIQAGPDKIAPMVPERDDPDVEAEVSRDLERFSAEGLDPESHIRSVCAGIAVRRWIEKEDLAAFSMNFLAMKTA